MTSGLNPTGNTYVALWNAVRIAADKCYEGKSCYDCIDPKCILDEINITSSIAGILKQNYENLVNEKLNDAYDIDPSTVSTTALDVKEFLVKEDCGPTVVGVCGVEIFGEDFEAILENGNPEDVDELLTELSKTKDWIKRLDFPNHQKDQIVRLLTQLLQEILVLKECNVF